MNQFLRIAERLILAVLAGLFVLALATGASVNKAGGVPMPGTEVVADALTDNAAAFLSKSIVSLWDRGADEP